MSSPILSLSVERVILGFEALGFPMISTIHGPERAALYGTAPLLGWSDDGFLSLSNNQLESVIVLSLPP